MTTVYDIVGYDTMSASALTAYGWSNSNPAATMTTGLRGVGQALAFNIGAGYGMSRIYPFTPKTTLVWGARIRLALLADNINQPFRVLTTAAGGGVANAYFASGWKVAVGGIPTTTTWAQGDTHYVETKLVVNGASGSITIRIDGVVQAGPTTVNIGSTGIGGEIISGQSWSNTVVYYDDEYWADDFLGDVKIETLLPTSAGATTQWTPLAGSNYASVNDNPPDGDTSYVSDATTGHLDTYTYANLASPSGTVFAVKSLLYARKDDAGTRMIAPVIRQGTTNYDQTTVSLPDSYKSLGEVYNLDPTGAAWTIANVNADEFGVKVAL